MILTLSPFLILPHPRLTPWLMALVPLLWLVRWLAQGHLTTRTPLDWPLLILMMMVIVSLWATFDPLLSFPGVCNLMLGIALYYALLNNVRAERAVWLTAGLILMGGVIVAGASLVGTRWPDRRKVPALSSFLVSIYEQLPLPALEAEAGFNPNLVGGTLVLFIPLAAALLLHQMRDAQRKPGWILSTLGLLGALVSMTFVLLLTQSRLAYAAAALALLLLGASEGRWARIGAGAILTLGGILVVVYGFPRSAKALFGLHSLETLSDYSTWAARMEIWNRSLRAVKDHPLTGIGFGTLLRVIHTRYPTFLIGAGRNVTYAHNLFLQVALDLGLPGLGAFIWFLAAFGRMMWQVRQRSTSPAHRALATGLSFGLVAQLIFGLADAITLGHKTSVLTWAFFGLGAALWVSDARETTR